MMPGPGQVHCCTVNLHKRASAQCTAAVNLHKGAQYFTICKCTAVFHCTVNLHKRASALRTAAAFHCTSEHRIAKLAQCASSLCCSTRLHFFCISCCILSLHLITVCSTFILYKLRPTHSFLNFYAKWIGFLKESSINWCHNLK